MNEIEIRDLMRMTLTGTVFAIVVASVLAAFYILQVRPDFRPRPTAEEMKEIVRAIDAVTDINDLKVRLKGSLRLNVERDHIYLDALDLFAQVIVIEALFIAVGLGFLFFRLRRLSRKCIGT